MSSEHGQEKSPCCGRFQEKFSGLCAALGCTGEHPLCPKREWTMRLVAMILVGLLYWGVVTIVVEGDGWVHIILAIVIAQVVGQIVHHATCLPPLLGMLLVGAVGSQLGYLRDLSDDHETIFYFIRSTAVVVLMIRAGFHLDPHRVRELPSLLLGLAIIPGLVECVTVVILGHYVLALPWEWAMLLGIVLAAACPSVVRPCFCRMGAGREVNSVLLTAACLNDIIALTGFGVSLSIIFSNDNLQYMLLHRLLGVVCGFTLGVSFGLFLRWVPEKNDPHMVSLRSVMLAAVGLFAMLGSERIGFVGGGPVTCIVASAVSSAGWREQGWGPRYNPVSTVFDVLWRIMQPVMFCLMGTEVDFTALPGNQLLLGICVLLVAWVIRVVVSMMVTSVGDLDIRERLYITFAWLPKADVQAALCPFALDLARKRHEDSLGPLSQSMHAPATAVMMLVLLAVLLTAPLSAALKARRGLAAVLLPSPTAP